MNILLPRLVSIRIAAATCFAAVSLLSVQQKASAQTTYYYPANSYVWRQASHPTTRYYSAPRTTSYRSPRPYTGYGSNLHRNFTIRQEQIRSQKTGLAPRNRGNVRWVR